MKKYLAIAILLFSFVFKANAQTRGIKIGYIDMEYILQNVPDYAEAKSQLEQKAEKWKQEIETKKIEIAKLKDALKTERALLTKELIAEREEEIKFQEDELLTFQQKKFGPNGDLITQKAVLIKPIQDQVFTAVQDIAELKKYDYIFDKSSDLTMLFAAKRHDVSDIVLRSLTRAEKREQLSKKQLKEQEAKDYQENLEDANPSLAARKKVLEEKKLAREKLMEERKQMIELKKLEQEENRKKLLEEKEAKKAGIVPPTEKSDINKTTAKEGTTETENTDTAEKAKEEKAAARAKIIEDRKLAAEAKKQEQEENRKKLLEEKEAKKNGTIPASEKTTTNKSAAEPSKPETDTDTTKTSTEVNSADAKDAKAAAREKLIEDRKKLLEEKRKKLIEEKDSIKKAREEKANETKTK